MLRNKSLLEFDNTIKVECVKPDGTLRWETSFPNTVFDAGVEYILDSSILGGAQTTSWFVGLISASPTIDPTDTSASHTGWTEVTTYDETTRPAYSGTRTSKTISNSASLAVFTINADGTLGGAFLASSSTKGSTTDLLLAGGPFQSGDRQVFTGDTIRIQYDLSG